MLIMVMATASDETLSFDTIHYSNQSKHNKATPTTTTKFTPSSHGKFKMAQGGVGWKESATGMVITVKKEDIKQASWCRGFHSGWTLFFDTNSEDDVYRHSFHGFNSECRERVEQFINSNYNIPFINVQLDKRGWNWGQVRVDEEADCLSFITGSSEQPDNGESEKSAFMIPLKSISNVAVTGRAELCIEMASDPMISEIRFHVPGKTTVDENDDDDGDNDGNLNEEQRMEKELLKEQVDAASALCGQIKSAAGLEEESAGETLMALSDVSCLIPRGRYDLDFGVSNVRLHGRTYDHRIHYNNVLRLIVLPKADDFHVLVILHVEPPLRHGQTKYPFIVFSLPKDEHIEVEPVNKEQAVEKKLQSKYDGPTYEVLASLFRQLTGQKISSPDPHIKFNSSSNLPCVRCTNKANEGHLYPMEKGLFYLPKPSVWIPYSDILTVFFSRSGSGLGNPRSFDMKLVCKSMDLPLSGVPKEELSVLTDLFNAKNIKLIDEAETISSSSASQKKKRKPENEQEESEDEVEMGSAAEEDTSTDEDYKDGDDGSDDVGEEYDEDYESDEDEDEEDDEEDSLSEGETD